VVFLTSIVQNAMLLLTVGRVSMNTPSEVGGIAVVFTPYKAVV